MIRAHSRQDIITALRLRDEFGFELWLDGAADAHLMTDLLLEADVPVLLHPPMMRAGRETKNASFAAAAVLQKRASPTPFKAATKATCPNPGYCCSRQPSRW